MEAGETVNTTAKVTYVSADSVHQPVTDENTVAWWRIALVKIGVIVALPAFISGAEIGLALGLQRTLHVVLVSALILGLISALTATVASSISTADIGNFPICIRPFRREAREPYSSGEPGGVVWCDRCDFWGYAGRYYEKVGGN